VSGERVYLNEDYSPYCYVYDEGGEYKDLWDRKCKIKHFSSRQAQRDFLQKSKTLEGDVLPEDRTLIDRYSKIKEFAEIPYLDIHIIDIETKADQGFPQAERLEDEILLITVYSTLRKKYYVFGTHDYDTDKKEVEYIYCEDERDLLRKYMDWHCEHYPDILTGWNSRWFDIPYIMERMSLIYSDSFRNSYSPINIIREQEDNFRGKQRIKYNIAGISQLDYLELYKAFSINERESYTLNYIAHVELGEQKLKFDGHLKDLWKEDWQKFVEYNIKDVYLVKRFEEKLGYIKLVQTQSYLCRVTFEKFETSIRKFDNYFMSVLKEQKIVLPTTKRNEKKIIPGGFVSEPQTGYYNRVVSYDFTSLYPHIIMALNISPETFLGKIEGDYTDLDLETISDKTIYVVVARLGSRKEMSGAELKNFILQKNIILSPNGVLYTSKEGFIPKIIKEVYTKRKKYKDRMQECEKLYKETHDEKYNLEKNVCDSFQYALKIFANSSYGVLANEWFRLFNPDFASSITLMGQKINKYTAKKINFMLMDKLKLENAPTIYQDTDSCYLNFVEICEKLNITENRFVSFVNMFDRKYLTPYLVKQFKYYSKQLHNIDYNYFDLKREVIAKGAIFIQKKKYSLYVLDSEGFTYDKPQIKTKGIEIVRSSTPSFCREKIKEVVKSIFENFDKDKLREELKQIRSTFKKQEVTEIAFPRNINNLEKYVSGDNIVKGTPIHIRAARNYNMLLKGQSLLTEYEEIYNSDKIKFIYLKKDNPIKENIIAFKTVLPKEFKFSQYIDYDTQFEKSFMAPIRTILHALDWQIELDEENIMDDFF